MDIEKKRALDGILKKRTYGDIFKRLRKRRLD